MATTDARPGFRLPGARSGPTRARPAGATTETRRPVAEETEPWRRRAPPEEASPRERDPQTETAAPRCAESASGRDPDAEAAPPAPAPKPNKLMADLTKAMQAAAEAARDETMARFAGRAKAVIDPSTPTPPTRPPTCAGTADEDVAAIRDWSKAEIARIREETESRITGARPGSTASWKPMPPSIERGSSGSSAASTPSRRRWPPSSSACSPRRTRLGSRPWPRACPSRPSLDDEHRDDPPCTRRRDGRDRRGARRPRPSSRRPPTPPETPWPRSAVTAPPRRRPSPSPRPSPRRSRQPGRRRAEAEPPRPRRGRRRPRDSRRPRPEPGLAAAEAEAARSRPRGRGRRRGRATIPAIDDDALAARLAGLVAGRARRRRASRPTRVVVDRPGQRREHRQLQAPPRPRRRRPVGRRSSGPDGEFVFAVNHAADVDLRDAIPPCRASRPGSPARPTTASRSPPTTPRPTLA